MDYSGRIRSRCWVVTVHVQNMQNAGLTEEQIKDPEFVGKYFLSLWENSGKGRYGAIVVCRSENLTFHCHMGCYGNTTTLKAVSDVLFQSHVEPQLGTKEELKAYMLKVTEHAEKKEEILFQAGLEDIEDEQGKRSDLEVIEDLLNQGHTPEQIFEVSFRYRRFEKMIRAHYLQLRKKATPLIKQMWNEYHFGASGTGKTYTYFRLCEKHGEDAVYLCNDYANSGASGGGLDYYVNNPAKILVLDEFRGNMPYANLLALMDVYSRHQYHARYQNGYNLWSSVYVCSIYPPERAYSFMVDGLQQDTDSIRQLLRRINRVVYHWKDKDEHFRTVYINANQYVNELQMKLLAEECEKMVPYETYETLQRLKAEEDQKVIFADDDNKVTFSEDDDEIFFMDKALQGVPEVELKPEVGWEIFD